ncbi:hypothetical protein D9V37_15810 [Nocardioides mangrovicus]|uniref:Glycosyltransferase n=1 Tax=Nocardioides mangrovicus TaxID=2478913 RepID=A0A3L8NZU0_9ACTN|nr:hypothetical protein [Nocardioides mangrovicus]RLV47628.1 hypothetical protein D9V37_15810 [Nocardioides mangrovicus]
MIRLMAPDLPALSGGLKVMYDLVAGLESAGLPARVWHGRAGFEVAGLAGTAPVEAAPRVRLEPGDLLVMPEVGGAKWSGLNPEVPTVMLVQGIDFLAGGAAFDRALPGTYPGWPQAVAAVAVSDVIEEYLRALSPELVVHRVPVVVDAERFAPQAKERLVSFMPRRRPEDLMAALQLLHRRGRFAPGSREPWRLQPIEAMTPAQVADVLGRSAVFLAGGEREGFGLPAAEAMAAGAHVVGWTGHGGREFLLPELATTVDDSDVVAMADGVEAAMDLFEHDRAAFDARARAGRDLVTSRYSRSAQQQALAEAFGELLAPGSPALVREPVVVTHTGVHAPPTSRLGRAYVAARTVGGRVKRVLRRR